MGATPDSASTTATTAENTSGGNQGRGMAGMDQQRLTSGERIESDDEGDVGPQETETRHAGRSTTHTPHSHSQQHTSNQQQQRPLQTFTTTAEHQFATTTPPPPPSSSTRPLNPSRARRGGVVMLGCTSTIWSKHHYLRTYAETQSRHGCQLNRL